jgi:hypothetical protein
MTDREALTYLARDYTYSEIRARTSIPESTISYVISGQRELSAKYKDDLTSYAYIYAYKHLQEEGAGETTALTLAGQSLEKIDSAVSKYQKIVEEYAKTWQQIGNRALYDDETGKMIYYNLDRSINNWEHILSKWDIKLSDLEQAPRDEYPPITK